VVNLGQDKFSIKPIQISDESLDRFKVDFNAPDVTREQIKHYRQVWLKEINVRTVALISLAI